MMILFFDVETGGFVNDRLSYDHPAQPPLVQIGAILVDSDNGAEWATLELIVKPDGYEIPTAASSVHGVTTKIAHHVGVPLSLAVAAYCNLRAKADLLVAYNKNFDVAIMEIAIARNGKRPSHPGPDVECAMELVTPLAKMPPTAKMIAGGYGGDGGRYKPPKLTEAHQFLFGEGFDGAHSALADARATMRVWFECKKRLTEEANKEKAS